MGVDSETIMLFVLVCFHRADNCNTNQNRSMLSHEGLFVIYTAMLQ